MKDLQDWTTGLYEHYGWMVLAKRRGHREKIRAYLKSLDHLCDAIQEKKKMTQNQNRKMNLNVLNKKVTILQNEACKKLK